MTTKLDQEELPFVIELGVEQPAKPVVHLSLFDSPAHRSLISGDSALELVALGGDGSKESLRSTAGDALASPSPLQGTAVCFQR